MEDVVEMEDTSPISVLPHEVLSEIFEFLPLADRKSVRRVSRFWYDSCICASITKREKFVFRTASRIEDIADVILRSKYSQLDLEFQYLPIGSLPAHMWKECSQRIRMLEFHECEWDDETISNIILHCENLASLVVRTLHRAWKSIDMQKYLYSPNLLTDFVEKGIRRPNLHTLSILISCVDVSDGMFSSIFLIHPRIKHFHFRMDSLKYTYPYSWSTWLLQSEESPRFMRLDECVNPDTPLESLKFNVTSHGRWMEPLVDDGEGGLIRLKHFEAKLISLKRSKKDTIFDFFKSQRDLEIIKLSIMEGDKDEIEELFFHILESCPNLREFRLRTPPYYMERSEVPRFVASISKLKAFRFNFNLKGEEPASPFQDLLQNPVQLNLTSLKWKQKHDSDSDLCHALLPRCSFLRHLHLTVCYDTTLQIIFQYLPELQTLILGCIEECTDFGFTGRDVDGNEKGYSIKRLQKLTYLELYSREYGLTEKSALELQLPRLEFLSLNVGWYKQLSKEALNQLASYFPELRVLAIEFNSLDGRCIEKTIEFCKELKNLQRLIVLSIWFRKHMLKFNEFEIVDKEQVESVFNACHWLKYLSWAKCYTFYRDLITGKVVRNDWGIFKFPGNIFNDEPA